MFKALCCKFNPNSQGIYLRPAYICYIFWTPCCKVGPRSPDILNLTLQGWVYFSGYSEPYVARLGLDLRRILWNRPQLRQQLVVRYRSWRIVSPELGCSGANLNPGEGALILTCCTVYSVQRTLYIIPCKYSLEVDDLSRINTDASLSKPCLIVRQQTTTMVTADSRTRDISGS